MGRTKAKLQNDQLALGGWIMIGHPSVAEILAGEGFDWLAVDMEHTSTTVRMFHELSLAVKGTGVDLLVRLPGHDPLPHQRIGDAARQPADHRTGWEAVPHRQRRCEQQVDRSRG